jgi:hypothetical protein
MVNEVSYTKQEDALFDALARMSNSLAQKSVSVSFVGSAMFYVGLRAAFRAPEWAAAVNRLVGEMPGSPDALVDVIIRMMPMESIEEPS